MRNTKQMILKHYLSIIFALGQPFRPTLDSLCKPEKGFQCWAKQRLITP